MGGSPKISQKAKALNQKNKTADYAYEEAQAVFGNDPRQYSIQTKKLVADKNGHLKELHTIQMKKVKNDTFSVPGISWNSNFP